MTKSIGILLLFFVLAKITLLCVSCASISYPSGGPRDTLHPIFIKAIPRDSATKVKTRDITLYFNKYVDIKNIHDNLIVSPYPVNSPVVTHRLKTLLIHIRDSLKQQTTYMFNFGNAVVDINEGNILKNFTYVFSTGAYIDSNTIKGRVLIAETGLPDSTLIVALYKNLADSAVKKTKPNYIAKCDKKGKFFFNYMPPGVYNIFVLPNDFSKKYDDSTKLFAFLDSPIIVEPYRDTSYILYAFQQYKKKEKKTDNATSSANAQTPSRSARNKKTIILDTIPPTFKTNLEGGKQDILSDLILTFDKKIALWDSNKIILVDSNYEPISNYTVRLDTSSKILSVHYPWEESTAYTLFMDQGFVTDTAGNQYPKRDTISLITKSATEYGSIKIVFNGLNFANDPVLEIVKDDKILLEQPITSNEFDKKLFYPGDYFIRILYDRNHSGKWETGDYSKRLQPKIVVGLAEKFTVKSNWDNEVELNF